jgi:hypothetical protein
MYVFTFDNTKRSAAGFRGFFGSYRMTLKNNTLVISAIDAQLVG